MTGWCTQLRNKGVSVRCLGSEGNWRAVGGLKTTHFRDSTRLNVFCEFTWLWAPRPPTQDRLDAGNRLFLLLPLVRVLCVEFLAREAVAAAVGPANAVTAGAREHLELEQLENGVERRR